MLASIHNMQQNVKNIVKENFNSVQEVYNEARWEWMDAHTDLSQLKIES